MYIDTVDHRIYNGKKKPQQQQVKVDTKAATRKSMKLFKSTRDFNKLQALAKRIKDKSWELDKYTDVMWRESTARGCTDLANTKKKVSELLDSLSDDLTSYIGEMYPNG